MLADPLVVGRVGAARGRRGGARRRAIQFIMLAYTTPLDWSLTTLPDRAYDPLRIESTIAASCVANHDGRPLFC